jgi:hypothetical protein
LFHRDKLHLGWRSRRLWLTLFFAAGGGDAKAKQRHGRNCASDGWFWHKLFHIQSLALIICFPGHGGAPPASGGCLSLLKGLHAFAAQGEISTGRMKAVNPGIFKSSRKSRRTVANASTAVLPPTTAATAWEAADQRHSRNRGSALSRRKRCNSAGHAAGGTALVCPV